MKYSILYISIKNQQSIAKVFIFVFKQMTDVLRQSISNNLKKKKTFHLLKLKRLKRFFYLKWVKTNNKSLKRKQTMAKKDGKKLLIQKHWRKKE